LDVIEDAWEKKMAQLGIDPAKIETDDALRLRYMDERVKFLGTRRYAERIWGQNGFNTQIRQREITIAAVRRKAFPDDDYLQLYRLFEARLEMRIIRPRTPDLEISRKWDQISIQDPTNFGLGGVLDIAVHTSSIVDPRVILHGRGSRGFSVDDSTTITNNHDKSWNASGSAGYMSFFKGSVSTQSTESFRSTISKIRNIKVDFDHVGELQLYRDQWFASTLLTDNKRVKEYLKSRPALASKLNLLTTGLAIGRGLKLTLEFKDESDVHEWGSSSTSGGGGVTIGGFKLGGSGGGNSSYDRRTVDIKSKSVTFTDDPTVCRIIGVRTTPLDARLTNFSAIEARPIWELPNLQEEYLKDWGKNIRPNPGGDSQESTGKFGAES
jgi:hypothetical protein